MKGKRVRKRLLREMLHRHMNADTNPALCDCGHEGLPAMWHGDCEVKRQARAERAALLNP